VKAHIRPAIKAHLLRGAFYLLALLTVCVIPFASGQRQVLGHAAKQNPAGIVCNGVWQAGPEMPSTGVRMVGVQFGKFYAMGGRSMDGVGHDFTHPFEYDPTSNTWTIKSATYPDNQVSDMACGVLNDSGTNYIYCVGGSAGGQTTATDRVFRYNPVTDVIETIPAPWPGDSDGITLPGGFTVFNNKLYILGGFRINTAMVNTIWEFTPTTNMWVLKNAVLPVARGYIPTLAVYDFKVGSYLIYTGGGSDWNGTTLVDTTDSFKYDPVADSITTIANIPRATGETRALVWSLPKLPQEMWVMGGGRTPPNPSNEIDIYVPFENTWGTNLQFITARRNFATDSDGGCGGFFGTGHIWLAGGYDSNGMPLSSMEIYCFPCATPTPTATPTATITPTPTASPTPTATATASPMPPPPCEGRVLIVYTDFGVPAQLQSEILAEPGITAVDLFDAHFFTPTLSQLLEYNIVVAYSYGLFFADSVILGNNLADYVDAGGVVVQYGYAFYGPNQPFGINGRWLTGGYNPYDYSTITVDGLAFTLGSYNAGHPLMAGVTTLNSNYHQQVTLAAGATQVATASSGDSLVAYRPVSGHTTVGVTAYVGYEATQSGDWGKVVANAGRWLLSCTLTPTPTATPTITASATPTPTPAPRPSPTPRPRPTPAPRP
jgi:hypothetical protein